MKQFFYTTDKSAVRCVMAHHIGDDREYTWSVAPDIEIIEGELLLVSITCNDGISLVIATTDIFYITKEEHEEQIHPYCSVLKNLGTEYLSEIIDPEENWEHDYSDGYADFEDSEGDTELFGITD